MQAMELLANPAKYKTWSVSMIYYHGVCNEKKPDFLYRCLCDSSLHAWPNPLQYNGIKNCKAVSVRCFSVFPENW